MVVTVQRCEIMHSDSSKDKKCEAQGIGILLLHEGKVGAQAEEAEEIGADTCSYVPASKCTHTSIFHRNTPSETLHPLWAA
jgi:hypothetical protein